MHPKVEAYIQEKETARQASYNAKKQEFLLLENLTDFVPNPDPNCGYTDEYPCRMPNPETGTHTYGKMVPIEITDEEYELLRAASRKKGATSDNKVASILQYIAYAIYALAGFVAFTMLASDFEYLWRSALIYLVTGLISGTTFLGFAEIINLLQKINEKQK